MAVKVAPFNRYRTLDVVKGVVAARAEDRVTLYTGNDDHIVGDLVTPFVVPRDGADVTVRIRGCLLGHWSVWTKSAVELLATLHAAVARGPVPPDVLALDAKVTDANSAFFDVIDSILRSLGINDVDQYCGQELYRFWQGSNEFCSVSP